MRYWLYSDPSSLRQSQAPDQDAKRKADQVKRLDQKRLREIRRAEEKERFRLKEEKRLEAERKAAEAKCLEKRTREASERERLNKVEQERLRRELKQIAEEQNRIQKVDQERRRKELEEQKRREEQPLVGANAEQNSFNGIQNSLSQPLPINTGQPIGGHAEVQDYLGDDVSSDGSWTGASHGDVEFAPGYGQDQYYDPSGLHIVDRNGFPVSNVPEPVQINQHDARQNDVHMHDYRNDQLDYSQPEDSQSENMQQDNQIGHGDPNYWSYQSLCL